MRYILASASPRRKELLAQAGFTFEVFPSSAEEKTDKEVPADIVAELALTKALDVYNTFAPQDNMSSLGEDFTIIGADTIVVYRGEMLGKPADDREAYDMLSMLADRTHQVYTGVALVTREKGGTSTRTFHERTDVTLYPITREDLHSYVASGDSLDKAGAYGIQGPFAVHVRKIDGDYNNVVGLPIARLYHELQSL